MTEDPAHASAVKLAAMLQIEALVYVTVSIREDVLEVAGPFGQLTIPYARMAEVALDPAGEIRLNVQGATVRLYIGTVLERNALFALLQEKTVNAER